MTIEDMMMTKNRFTKMVEDVVKQKRISYMDAIIHLCEKNNIEVEDAKKFVSPVIKNKVEAEAMRLNFLPRGNELPFE
jgi:hypothetical protein